MKKGPIDQKKDTESDDELNEEMLDEFLDWRSKKSWRQPGSFVSGYHIEWVNCDKKQGPRWHTTPEWITDSRPERSHMTCKGEEFKLYSTSHSFKGQVLKNCSQKLIMDKPVNSLKSQSSSKINHFFLLILLGVFDSEMYLSKNFFFVTD